MSQKSCLNCLHGKSEEQPEGYYCGTDSVLPEWLAENHAYNCEFYKPRQTRCETEKCEWFDKHEGKDFCYYDDDHWVGAICEDFNREDTKKEAEMQIEFQGKKYERTDKKLTLRHLFEDARGCPDAAKSIHRFWHEFFDSDQDFNLSLSPFTANQRHWLLHDSDLHIPWLVEKGYLREVVEEVKQLPNQWYRGNESKALYYSRIAGDLLVRLKSKDISTIGSILPWSKEKFTPTSVKITEQPELAERRPEKCVHLTNEPYNHCSCQNRDAMTFFGVYPENLVCNMWNHNRYKTCPEYTEE